MANRALNKKDAPKCQVTKDSKRLKTVITRNLFKYSFKLIEFLWMIIEIIRNLSDLFGG